jgi:hypothetical protein
MVGLEGALGICTLPQAKLLKIHLSEFVFQKSLEHGE